MEKHQYTPKLDENHFELRKNIFKIFREANDPDLFQRIEVEYKDPTRGRWTQK